MVGGKIAETIVLRLEGRVVSAHALSSFGRSLGCAGFRRGLSVACCAIVHVHAHGLMPGVAILSRCVHVHAHAWSSHILPLRVGLVPGVACLQMSGHCGKWQHVARDQPAGTTAPQQAHDRQAGTADSQLAQCSGEHALHVFAYLTARPESYHFISIVGLTIH